MQLGEQKWIDVPTLTDRVAVVPLGSLEQHGHHLPLLTDSLICEELARRAERELGEEAVFLPLLWIGASDHHRAFPGTVSVSNDVYVQLLINLLESLIGSGFRRILLLNAHGGNELPGSMATYEIIRRYHTTIPELWIAFSNWMDLARDDIGAVVGLQQTHVIHACELETSMILAQAPDLVAMEAAKATAIPFASAFYSPDFSTASKVRVPRMFDQLSATGAFGFPEAATREKGEELFRRAAATIVAFVREFRTWPAVKPVV